MIDDRALQERVGALDGLLQQVDAIADADARSTALAAVQSLLELYGEGLARLADGIAERCGPDALEAIAKDELVAHLLLLHGLHPIDLEARVRSALDGVRPYLASHGGNVELLGIEEGTARLRLQGTCSGCSSSETTLRLLIERAIQEAAPDLEAIETEAVSAAPSSSFIALDCLTPMAVPPA
jgi:Fe-S cluster biogenesis protein NfuA